MRELTPVLARDRRHARNYPSLLRSQSTLTLAMRSAKTSEPNLETSLADLYTAFRVNARTLAKEKNFHTNFAYFVGFTYYLTYV